MPSDFKCFEGPQEVLHGAGKSDRKQGGTGPMGPGWQEMTKAIASDSSKILSGISKALIRQGWLLESGPVPK